MTFTRAGFSAWDVVVAAGLTTSSLIYITGFARLRRHVRAAHGAPAAGLPRGALHVVLFALGIATLVVALLSPLDSLSDLLFSAHMGQHELLMLVAAPLLIMGRPNVAALWALPERARAAVAGFVRRPRLRAVWRWVTGPVVILVLHAVALWIWHVPRLFEGAMHSEAVHAFQHLCFFITAALFWYTLTNGRYGRAGYGAAVVFVFLTAMHSGALGALITLAGTVWYPIYGDRSRAAGVDPLVDQQLAGLLMWIPAGVILMVLGLGLLAAWLGAAERRAARLGAAVTPPIGSGSARS
jgi:putative membrane protein